ncbi:MAG: L-ribulose-5-phosphate 3-epimerase [Spirochaetaceae bacterium]|jgi:predicted hexulose-6-phosphate isomerase|nr:L-ribulose-5-phosphate 3-epimerase [Spirochaetaceae bacterium]
MAHSYQLGLYEKAMPGTLTFKEKLEAVKSAGFDFMELSVDETDEKLARLDWNDSEIHDLRRLIEGTGVPVSSICLSAHRRFPLGDPDTATRNRSLAIMEKAILLAVRLGVRIIQIAGYDVYYKESTDDTKKFFADSLARSVELAAASSVLLAFETMETPFINTVEKATRWVNEISSPYLAVYPDLGNITNAADGDSDRVSADIQSGRGHIAAMHLKESKPGIFREVPYGEGHVDFARGVKTAWTLGVRMFTGEFWYTAETGDSWRELLAANAKFLRGFCLHSQSLV